MVTTHSWPRIQLCICPEPFQPKRPSGSGPTNHRPVPIQDLDLPADPSALLPAQLTRGHQVALSSISYVGCSVSVLCLIITLVTFAMLS